MTLLIDASAYLFRAWFGVPDVFTDRRGRPLNAVVGFARTLGSLLREAQPASVALAFDESLFSGFRHRLDPDYKANRALPDRDLARQMKACRELADGLGLATVASREYEADDLLASMARRAGKRGEACLVAGEDKDLAQLLDLPGLQFWQYARQRLLDREAAARWLEFDPARLPEFQALTGDSGDNIPGVPGFGPVSARAALAACDHLDALLARPERVAELPIRGAARLAVSLAEHRQRARLNLRLATLARRAAGLPKPAAMRYRPPPAAQLAGVLADIGLPAGSARAFEVADADRG